MYHEVINLRDESLCNGFMPTLTAYRLSVVKCDCPRPAVIVCPGGGYQYCSGREGERIALNYNAAGFHSFVIYNSVAPNKHPEPIRDLATAVTLVRQNAVEWNINPDQIVVAGFSAGGHLAASLAVHWDNPEIFTETEIEAALHKPNAHILGYPVITSGEFAHIPSFEALLGENADKKLMDMMSLEKQVKETTAPAFLWHGYNDALVPVENTLLYAQALSKYRIPIEVHIYPDGKHGLSLYSDETFWSVNLFRRKYDWLSQSVEWLIDLFELKLRPIIEY